MLDETIEIHQRAHLLNKGDAKVATSSTARVLYAYFVVNHFIIVPHQVLYDVRFEQRTPKRVHVEGRVLGEDQTQPVIPVTSQRISVDNHAARGSEPGRNSIAGEAAHEGGMMAEMMINLTG